MCSVPRLSLFCGVLAILVYLYVQKQPESVFVVLHRAYTLKHTMMPLPAHALPMVPLSGDFAHPSAELVAMDALLRAGQNDEVQDVNVSRSYMKAFSDVLESHEVPAEQVQEIVVPASEQKAWWVHWPGVSNNTDAPTIIYIHGGGRFSGSSEYLTGFFYRLSRASGARVLGIDYSLGPESSILRATDDTVAAYEYLLNVCSVPPESVIISGESGGGLMAGLTLLAIRDRKLPTPAGGWLICMQADLTASLPSITENHGRDAMVSGVVYTSFIPWTVGDASLALDDARVSPAFAAWDRLPPLLFSVGENEVLRDDTLECAMRAREAGVSVRVDLRPHVMHGFPLFAGYAPELDAGFYVGAEFIRERLQTSE